MTFSSALHAAARVAGRTSVNPKTTALKREMQIHAKRHAYAYGRRAADAALKALLK